MTWWQWALLPLVPGGFAGGYVLNTMRLKAAYARERWTSADRAQYVSMDTAQRRAWGYRQIARVLTEQAAFADEKPGFRAVLLEHAGDWAEASSEILQARAAKGLQAPTE